MTAEQTQNCYKIDKENITKLESELDKIDDTDLWGNDSKELLDKGKNTLQSMERSILKKINYRGLGLDGDYVNSFNGKLVDEISSAKNEFEKAWVNLNKLYENPPYRDGDLIDIIMTQITSAVESYEQKIQTQLEEKEKVKEKIKEGLETTKSGIEKKTEDETGNAQTTPKYKIEKDGNSLKISFTKNTSINNLRIDEIIEASGITPNDIVTYDYNGLSSKGANIVKKQMSRANLKFEFNKEPKAVIGEDQQGNKTLIYADSNGKAITDKQKKGYRAYIWDGMGDITIKKDVKKIKEEVKEVTEEKKKQEKAKYFDAKEDLKGLNLEKPLAPAHAEKFYKSMITTFDSIISRCKKQGIRAHHEAEDTGEYFSKLYLSRRNSNENQSIFEFHGEKSDGENIDIDAFNKTDLGDKLYNIVDDNESEFVSYINSKFGQYYDKKFLENEKIDIHKNMLDTKEKPMKFTVAGKEVSIKDVDLSLDRGSKENVKKVQEEIQNSLTNIAEKLVENGYNIPADSTPFEKSYSGGYIEFAVEGMTNSNIELFMRKEFEENAIGNVLESNANKNRLINFLNQEVRPQAWKHIYREKHAQKDSIKKYLPLTNKEKNIEIDNNKINSRLEILDKYITTTKTEIEQLLKDNIADYANWSDTGKVFGILGLLSNPSSITEFIKMQKDLDEGEKQKLSLLVDNLSDALDDYKFYLDKTGTTIKKTGNYNKQRENYKKYFEAKQGLLSATGTDTASADQLEDMLLSSNSEEKLKKLKQDIPTLLEIKGIDGALDYLADMHRKIDANDRQHAGAKQGYREYMGALEQAIFDKIKTEKTTGGNTLSIKDQRPNLLKLIKIMRADGQDSQGVDFEIDDDLRNFTLCEDIFEYVMFGKPGKNGKLEGGIVDEMDISPKNTEHETAFNNGNLKNIVSKAANNNDVKNILAGFTGEKADGTAYNLTNIPKDVTYNDLTIEQKVMVGTIHEYTERWPDDDFDPTHPKFVERLVGREGEGGGVLQQVSASLFEGFDEQIESGSRTYYQNHSPYGGGGGSVLDVNKAFGLEGTSFDLLQQYKDYTGVIGLSDGNIQKFKDYSKIGGTILVAVGATIGAACTLGAGSPVAALAWGAVGGVIGGQMGNVLINQQSWESTEAFVKDVGSEIVIEIGITLATFGLGKGLGAIVNRGLKAGKTFIGKGIQQLVKRTPNMFKSSPRVLKSVRQERIRSAILETIRSGAVEMPAGIVTEVWRQGEFLPGKNLSMDEMINNMAVMGGVMLGMQIKGLKDGFSKKAAVQSLDAEIHNKVKLLKKGDTSDPQIKDMINKFETFQQKLGDYSQYLKQVDKLTTGNKVTYKNNQGKTIQAEIKSIDENGNYTIKRTDGGKPVGEYIIGENSLVNGVRRQKGLPEFNFNKQNPLQVGNIFEYTTSSGNTKKVKIVGYNSKNKTCKIQEYDENGNLLSETKTMKEETLMKGWYKKEGTSKRENTKEVVRESDVDDMLGDMDAVSKKNMKKYKEQIEQADESITQKQQEIEDLQKRIDNETDGKKRTGLEAEIQTKQEEMVQLEVEKSTIELLNLTKNDPDTKAFRQTVSDFFANWKNGVKGFVLLSRIQTIGKKIKTKFQGKPEFPKIQEVLTKIQGLFDTLIRGPKEITVGGKKLTRIDDGANKGKYETNTDIIDGDVTYKSGCVFDKRGKLVSGDVEGYSINGGKFSGRIEGGEMKKGTLEKNGFSQKFEGGEMKSYSKDGVSYQKSGDYFVNDQDVVVDSSINMKAMKGAKFDAEGNLVEGTAYTGIKSDPNPQSHYWEFVGTFKKDADGKPVPNDGVVYDKSLTEVGRYKNGKYEKIAQNKRVTFGGKDIDLTADQTSKVDINLGDGKTLKAGATFDEKGNVVSGILEKQGSRKYEGSLDSDGKKVTGKNYDVNSKLVSQVENGTLKPISKKFDEYTDGTHRVDFDESKANSLKNQHTEVKMKGGDEVDLKLGSENIIIEKANDGSYQIVKSDSNPVEIFTITKKTDGRYLDGQKLENGTLTIGRNADPYMNHIGVDNASVSREHLAIEFGDDGVKVVDRRSSAGTEVRKKGENQSSHRNSSDTNENINFQNIEQEQAYNNLKLDFDKIKKISNFDDLVLDLLGKEISAEYTGKKAYKRLVLKYHSDGYSQYGHDIITKKADEIFKEIQNLWDKYEKNNT